MIPNATANILSGHRRNVKCVEFIGEEGQEIVSGSRCVFYGQEGIISMAHAGLFCIATIHCGYGAQKQVNAMLY